MSYRVSRRAEDDLVKIAKYTVGRWGGVQARAYVGALVDAFAGLAVTPESGVATQRPGVRRSPCGSHVIYYRIMRQGVVIVRVLHRRMRPELYL